MVDFELPRMQTYIGGETLISWFGMNALELFPFLHEAH